MKYECEQYANRFSNEPPDFLLLYKKLIEHSFIEAQTPPVKKITIGYYGFPLTYSFKYAKTESQKHLRTVFELGGVNMCVADQIEYSLSFLNNVMAELKWDFFHDINPILSIIYPEDMDEVNKWDSGMWIGLDSIAQTSVLKIYFPLRNYKHKVRWQKSSDVLCLFASSELESVFRFILKQAYNFGHPIGIGCGVTKNGLIAIRLYIGFEKINLPLFMRICSEFYPNQVSFAESFINSFCDVYSDKAVTTIAIDFALDCNKQIVPKPARVKLEFSCCGFSRDEQQKIPSFICSKLDALGLSGSDFLNDVSGAKQHFSDIFFQHCSIGLGKSGEHITVYFEPVAYTNLI